MGLALRILVKHLQFLRKPAIERFHVHVRMVFYTLQLWRGAKKFQVQYNTDSCECGGRTLCECGSSTSKGMWAETRERAKKVKADFATRGIKIRVHIVAVALSQSHRRRWHRREDRRERARRRRAARRYREVQRQSEALRQCLLMLQRLSAN